MPLLILRLARRGLITLLGISIAVFLGLHLIPGGFAQAYLPITATQAQRDALNQRYGLDQPLPLQYLTWLGNLAKGDFGTSMVTLTPVAVDMQERLPATVELDGLAALMAIVIGILLGILAGVSRNQRLIGSLVRLVSAAGFGIPDFVIGSVFVLVFTGSPFLVVGDYVPLFQDPLANLRTIFMPAVTLSLFSMALTLRTTRDSVLTVMAERFVSAAAARGETRWQVTTRHILRNAASPVIAVVSVNIGFLLGGAAIVENIFSIPGVGSYLVQGVRWRDYAVVQTVVLLASAVFVIVSTLADISYALVDPRSRSGVVSG